MEQYSFMKDHQIKNCPQKIEIKRLELWLRIKHKIVQLRTLITIHSQVHNQSKHRSRYIHKINYKLKIRHKHNIYYKLKIRHKHKINYKLKIRHKHKINYKLKIRHKHKINYKLKIRHKHKINNKLKIRHKHKINNKLKIRHKHKIIKPKITEKIACNHNITHKHKITNENCFIIQQRQATTTKITKNKQLNVTQFS